MSVKIMTYDEECAEWQARQDEKDRAYDKAVENLIPELVQELACMLHVKELGGVVGEDTQLTVARARAVIEEAKRLGYSPPCWKGGAS